MSGIVISGDTRGGVGAPAKKPTAANYKAVVGAVLTKLQQAWNKGDAAGVGSLFGKEADYVNVGGVMISGADKIAAAHKTLFDGAKGSQSAYRIIKMKPLAPDVVMAFLGQKMTFKQDGKEQSATLRPTMVLRKLGNDWKIAAFQVTRAGPQARAAGGGGRGAAAGKAAAKAAPAKAESKAPAKKAAKK